MGVISILCGFQSLPVLFEKGKKASVPSRFLVALKFLPSRGRLAWWLQFCLAHVDGEYTVFIGMLVLNCFKGILSGNLL